MTRFALPLVLLALISPYVAAETPAEKIMAQFIDAADGSVITLPEGRFELSQTLSISANNVTIRGAGADKTILSFKGQNVGNGIDATGKHLTFENFAILDPKADGLKVQNCEDLTIRGVSVDWSGPVRDTNGGYGLYPVACKHLLIEHNYVRGASDSGLYVGQSEDIIVRHNVVTENVAGIEIENSLRADVSENDAWGNTGGILVFSLPDLPVIRNGAGTRIFNNTVHDNNTTNFAPKGNIVGMVPAGTGIMILANRSVEVFGNTLDHNQSASVIVTSYYASERPIKDPTYEAQAREINIHDNVMRNAGYAAAGMLHDIQSGMNLAGVKTERMPHILHDGILAGKVASIHDLKLCMQHNQVSEPDTAFGNMALEDAGTFKALFRIWKPAVYPSVPAEFDCSMPGLPAVAAR
ncbi:MAG: right-handed parallel beta-helix repeat-containing protein [Burkholderiales bacterium]|nr:right-handed parallel beta-helix repeat-containing protein [Burkholderiales bacterium]